MSKQTGHSNPLSLISWVAALMIVVMVGGLWVLPAFDSAWNAPPLVAVLALTAVIAIVRQQSRARARRRLLAALEAYAQREIRQGGLRLPGTAENPASAS